jgi:Sel1 repeat
MCLVVCRVISIIGRRFPLCILLLLSFTASAAPTGSNGDEFLVVDCLLPTQIRQLGMRMTYAAPRQVIKASANDCALRGGEFTRGGADGNAALQAWMPAAQNNDPVAQVYVGEILERGIAGQPDYAGAAGWYRRAADAGDARAMVDLASLYDRGLGVARDPRAAYELLRRAAGLPPEPEPAAGATATISALNATIEEQRRRIAAQAAEIDRLNRRGRPQRSAGKRSGTRTQPHHDCRVARPTQPAPADR